MECEHLDWCPIIQHMSKIVPFTINMVKIKYCELDKYKCARYKLSQSLELDKIPDNLWPSDEMRAMELLEEKLNESHKKLYGCNREEIPAQG